MRNAGDLTELITLEKRSAVTKNGKSHDEWTAIGQYRAEVRHLSSSDFAAANARYDAEVIIVHLWTIPGQTMRGMRVLWGGEAYRVKEAIQNRPMPGITELRAESCGMED